jgi:hypothetical protein
MSHNELSTRFCLHALVEQRRPLPQEARPGWFRSIASNLKQRLTALKKR